MNVKLTSKLTLKVLKEVEWESRPDLPFNQAVVRVQGKVEGHIQNYFTKTWDISGDFLFFYDPGGGLHMNSMGRLSKDREWDLVLGNFVTDEVERIVGISGNGWSKFR